MLRATLICQYKNKTILNAMMYICVDVFTLVFTYTSGSVSYRLVVGDLPLMMTLSSQIIPEICVSNKAIHQ